MEAMMWRLIRFGALVQDRLTVGVLIEEIAFLDESNIVDSGEFAVGFGFKLTSVSLTEFNTLLSTF
jgi:hypothetical protein